MLRVLHCIFVEHDLKSVGLAGLICLLAAFTAFSMVEQARRAKVRRAAWLAAAGFVSGTGIWATHFIAMLAYRPGMAMGYDVGLTFLSIVVAIVLCSIGWWISLRSGRWAPLAAGAVIGSGISAMHYIGMSAASMAGRMVWDADLVVASIAIGILFSTLAVAVRRWRASEAAQKLPWPAALLFTFAICGMHFTAMGAERIVAGGAMAMPTSAISGQILAIPVTALTILILALAFAIVLFDRKLGRRAAEEADRLRSFADAAIEGLVVFDGDLIVDANRSFLGLAGYRGGPGRPTSLAALFPDVEPDKLPSADDTAGTECRLIDSDGRERPVEILVRPLDWGGTRLRILAVRDISERKEAEARIAHLAYHDALTGLPNRAVFAERLAKILDEGHSRPVAILCIDLDGFKGVNDLYGHPVGDELLIEVSQRLRRIAGEQCLVARLGGDEFAVVQCDADQPNHSGILADRLVQALSEPFQLEEQSVRISGSVGVAVHPQDASGPIELVKNADMALYRAKAEGGRTMRFYEVAMDEALRERRQLESALRLAIGRGELEVHYQPLADLESGRIMSFEALLRWTHPTRGAISPEIFIPLAEESGLIDTLGEWVLRQACAEAAGWQPALRLSVNLSPLQFMPGDLTGKVARILEDSGLDASRLDLEVTEGLLIKDTESALETLRGLKALGVQISMDDFGTGYASLSYFRLFPFDKVKIDRSFVHHMMDNPQALAIIRSVIGLGQGLGMPVIAEGVETEAQLEALRAEGCTQVQGYLISRPGPIENFDRIVIDRGPRKTAPVRRRNAA
jgi:diguanylate cyclase (GGDEF)-like protein/PAS domain S-box-containing protein